jgi:Secretion system C-terminal sorting domain/SprB repeat
MKQIVTIIALLCCIHGFASASKTPTVFSQLAEINKYWHQFNPDIKDLKANKIFTFEQQKIQTHLLYVEKYLGELPNCNLSITQIKNRKHCLAILHKYATQGLFPQNTHHAGQRVPYFIDDANTPCAVGHLMIETGFGAEAQQINRENNYGYIKDLVNEYPAIISWAKENGFDIDELAWIQPTYNFPQTISLPFALSDSNVVRNPTCSGSFNGVIKIDSNNFAASPKPLTATISYSSANGYPAGNIVQFFARNYSITVADANNVSTILNITLQDTSSNTLIIFESIKNGGCNTSISSGKITVNNVVGGTAPYTYRLQYVGINSSPPDVTLFIGDSSNVFNALASDNYYLYARDANGCATYKLVDVKDSSVLFTSHKIITPNNCINANAIIETRCSDFILNYIALDTISLPAGTTNVLLTNILGCTKNYSITVPTVYWQATAIGNTNIACNSGATNITIGHTFTNFNFGTFQGEGIFSRTAGVHDFIVTDGFGCSDTVTTILTEPDVLTNAVSAFPLQCFGDSTLISYTTNGGTAPYSYTYNFGAMLTAGNYTIQTTDANGCTVSNTITIAQPSAISNLTTAAPILCNGGQAAISHTTVGGTGIYTYDYPDGTLFAAGTYTIETTDGNGCKKNNTVTITEPTTAVTQTTFIPIICYGQSTAVNHITVGGTPPYIYNISDGLMLTAGNYIITNTDSNGCVFTNSITITQPNSMATSNLVTTSVAAGFSVNFTTQGGTGAYTYLFEKETGFASYVTIGSTGTLPYIVPLPGKYRVKITDANGCVWYLYFEVNYPVSIGKPILSTISISPNPFTHTIKINGIHEKMIGNKLLLIDVLGKISIEQNITNKEMNIDAKDIANGMYILKIGNEAYFIRKE